MTALYRERGPSCRVWLFAPGLERRNLEMKQQEEDY